MKNKHVTPRKDNSWAVKSAGSKKAERLFKTKGEAIAYAEKYSKDNESCLVIHNDKGKFEEKDCTLKEKNQHVVPYNGKWAVVRAKRRAAKVFRTKGSAMRHAYKVAKKDNVCMVTHGNDGKFKTFVCKPLGESPSALTRLRMATRI